MTIYLDVVFFENICMNGIILYSAAVVTKTKCKFFRILISSVVGALYAVRYIFDKQLYLFKLSIKSSTFNFYGIYSFCTKDYKAFV